MLGALFRRQGQFCARHPMEVVVSTLTVITCLMSFGSSLQYNSQDKVCGWNYECAKEQKLKSTDVIMLSVARCMALVYIYLQFRYLRRLGSKHVLGISGVFTIFSSFVFSIAFVKMYGNTMAGLYEVLPFFLFLIDLSKASALAVFALSSTSRDEIHENIGKAMALLGPSITLDMVVETLAVGLGTLSGVQQLEAMCSFGCLSVVANYVAFMTFYPACLALVLELTMEISANQSSVKYKKLAKELQEEHTTKTPNPVTQRVKFIMSIGLAVVHIHSKWIAPRLAASSSELTETIDMYREPIMSFWQFYLYKIFAVHVDYGLTLVLGVGLLLKYVFVDRPMELSEIKHTLELQRSFNRTSAETQTDSYQETDDDTFTKDNAIEEKPHFSVGDDDDDDDEMVSTESNGIMTESRDTQTDARLHGLSPLKRLVSLQEPRSIEECLILLKAEKGVSEMTDEEICLLVEQKHIPSYKLEAVLGDHERGVSIRRQLVATHSHAQPTLDSLPYSNYDYSYVDGACCENVVGYMPVPVGTAGPLLLDGRPYMVPMATTEGCLVASTNRGCRALSQAGGVRSSVVGDGMTRGPAVRFPSAIRASEVKAWLEDTDNFDLIKESFDLTSRFARLQRLHVAQAGRLLYIRFVATTGDAMGMNMLSKGTERALNTLQEFFSDMEILSLSGNFCTDKKSSAINWIEGRGKSVVCEAVVPARVVKNVLKTSVPALVDLNIHKNLVGSALAGSIGGFNAHAANVVAAIFIATGQDPAQTVASCSCITLMEPTGENSEDLYISCTMPSIEVGTVGGGTILPPQLACLQMLGVDGSAEGCPGDNARCLARVVCATVLAGELSLMSALAAGHLVRSHLKHNRSSISLGATPTIQREAASMPNIPGASTPARDHAHPSVPSLHHPTLTHQTGETTSSCCLPRQPELSPIHATTRETTSISQSHHPGLSPIVNLQNLNSIRERDSISMDKSIRTGQNTQLEGDLRHRRSKISKEAGDTGAGTTSSDLGADVGTCIKHVS